VFIVTFDPVYVACKCKQVLAFADEPTLLHNHLAVHEGGCSV